MFIARQPIFNKSLKIYGYELLFRADAKMKTFSNATSTSATAVVLGGLFEQGIDKVVGAAKAFINFDYEFIMSDAIELIDPDILVIEILEDVEFDDVILDRIQELRDKGYKIALDDFEKEVEVCSMVSKADIIKYDILLTPLDTIKMEVKKALLLNKILLAEKIETEEEYQKARDMGFQLFQGYFFSKPNIIAKESNAKKSSKTIYARILNELKREDFSYDHITNIIVSDVNLSYRLLWALSRKSEGNNYNSIKSALIRMGFKKIERFISILMLQDMTEDKPDEVYRLSLVRSKFGECVARRSSFKERKDEISMMCLFSMLDVILDSTMQEALEGLAISDDIIEALVHRQGIFKPICALMQSYEQGDWNEVDNYTKKIELNTEYLTDDYLSAIEWASGIINKR